MTGREVDSKSSNIQSEIDGFIYDLKGIIMDTRDELEAMEADRDYYKDLWEMVKESLEEVSEELEAMTHKYEENN